MNRIFSFLSIPLFLFYLSTSFADDWVPLGESIYLDKDSVTPFENPSRILFNIRFFPTDVRPDKYIQMNWVILCRSGKQYLNKALVYNSSNHQFIGQSMDFDFAKKESDIDAVFYPIHSIYCSK